MLSDSLRSPQIAALEVKATMKFQLKYGCNPHQIPASFEQPSSSPLQVLNGQPSYINILDALGAWQLARELKMSIGAPGAASFKHTSPAGAAIAGAFSREFLRSQFLPDLDYSPIAQAYIRARGGDRMSSFGDAVGVSEIVDISLAKVLKQEVSDLIIAPGYEQSALDILKKKKKGNYVIFKIDPDYEPPDIEFREVFGIKLNQKRNDTLVSTDHFLNIVSKNKLLPDAIRETLMVATISIKYTQSNSVCVAYDGQVIGMGAGQQSRIHCTTLACDKADNWILQQHPKALNLPFSQNLVKTDKSNAVKLFLNWEQLSEIERTSLRTMLTAEPDLLSNTEKTAWIDSFSDLCLSSDAYIPFRDNIDRASRSKVLYIAQTGSSQRDHEVTDAANEYDMVMVHTGLRCFLH